MLKPVVKSKFVEGAVLAGKLSANKKVDTIFVTDEESRIAQDRPSI